jgi:NTP pyrophosphatase (non-canonical NTP hydrolase)
MNLQKEFEPIRNWASDRGLYEKGDPKTQFVKLLEEVGELSRSILKEEDKDFVDAVGDCVVVLTNLAKLKGYDIETCINSAYIEIKNRKGGMRNGSFVKK